MRRSVLAVVLVASLLLAAAAGCSDDDGEGFPAALAEEDDAGAGSEGVCRLLTAAQLEAATGQPFRAGEPATGTCTYQGEDGRATVTVNVTDLPADAELALETTSSTCDPDTATDLEVTGATGAFACTVSGVAVAAGTSSTTYAVLAGALVGDPAAPADAFGALGQLLGAVLAAADRES